MLQPTLLLLLATASVPGPATSPLSEANHIHEWVLTSDEEGLRTWLDMSAKGKVIIDGETYPTFVRRAAASNGADDLTIFDTQHAVFCSRQYSGMALLRVWKVGPGFQGYDTPTEETHDVDFGTPLHADDPYDAVILEWACPELFKDQ